MRDAKDTLDNTFMEMRWRVLSLAADLDRIGRAPDGDTVLARDQRLARLKDALNVLLDGDANRAERVQLIFSDKTPPPAR